MIQIYEIPLRIQIDTANLRRDLEMNADHLFEKCYQLPKNESFVLPD
jgi:hypothetical protein